MFCLSRLLATFLYPFVMDHGRFFSCWWGREALNPSRRYLPQFPACLTGVRHGGALEIVLRFTPFSSSTEGGPGWGGGQVLFVMKCLKRSSKQTSHAIFVRDI